MHFSDVTLFSQDIDDEALRKSIVEMNQPRKCQPFLRRKQRQLKKAWNKLVSRRESFSLRTEDVSIRKEPAPGTLSRAFGLLAVCRK